MVRSAKRRASAGSCVTIRIGTPRDFAGFVYLSQAMQAEGIEQPTPTDVSRAICAIRSEKLPNPVIIALEEFNNDEIYYRRADEPQA